MNWKMNFFDKIGDFLRFLAYGCIAVNGIILAAWSVIIIAKFVQHAHGWLNRVAFGHSW